MYTYKPLKSIYVKNFRNVGDIKLDFTESPIISLIGENEAGKTSLLKAFAVCGLHAWPRDQKDYIRDGTNGFGVAIELEDSTLITRMKTATVNSYSVKYANGEVWDTNKIDSGLPVQVQEIMGLVEEPETKEFLQVRSYEDQLLFVTTSSSTNYKVMYDALKVDQLTRAIKVGSQEANGLRASIGESEISIRTLTDNLRSIKTYELEPIINIKNRLKEQLGLLDKLTRAKDILDRIKIAKEQLGSLSLIDDNSLSEVNMVEVSGLMSANRLLNVTSEVIRKCNMYECIHTLDNIDVAVESKMINALDKYNKLRIEKFNSSGLALLGELSEIGEYEVNTLNRAVSIKRALDISKLSLGNIDTAECRLIEQKDFDIINNIGKAINLHSNNKIIETERDKSSTYVIQVEEYLKKLGAKVINCTKCGESLVLDADSLTVHEH